MHAFLRRLAKKLFSTPTVVRRSNYIRPQVCQLEDRLTPTVSFTPKFGDFSADTLKTHNGAVLNSPSVVLIFEGSQWDDPNGIFQTGLKVLDLVEAANNVVTSSFTDPLDQYGSNGRSAVSLCHRFHASNPDECANRARLR